MTSLKVREVNSEKDMELFVRLPFSIYQHDPWWVPPIVVEQKRTLTPGRNPFWDHARRKLFLAERNGTICGRICATVDDNYNNVRRSKTGFFGFFECEDNTTTARALFDAVAGWCKDQGVEQIYGPANPSLNDEAGLLIGPFDGSPYIKMSYNPAYYPRLLESCGLTKAKDLYAYRVPLDQTPPAKLVRVMEHIKRKKGLRVRTLNLSDLSTDVRFIKEVYNDAWSNNWDYAPLTDAEVDDLARQLRPIVRPEICPMVFCHDEPAGICIALPDYNQVLKRMRGSLLPFGWVTFLFHRKRITRARLWALGVKRKFHNLGYDSLLYYEAFMGARRLGYTDSEVSWILEDNLAIIRPIELWNGERYRTYRIYRLQLSASEV
ncbi:MAG: N-acetyltransferase [candidate division WOR-3 bacterium]